MHRVKKVFLLLIIMFSCSFVSHNVYAEGNNNSETTEDNAAEASAGDAEENVKKQWKKYKDKGKIKYTYEIDGIEVTGWNKIDGKWYYFDGSRYMVDDRDVGIYKLDSNGALINGSESPDFKPKAHGEIISAKTAVLKDGHDDANKASAQIDSLYTDYINGKEIDPTIIRNVRTYYNSLSMSEKVWVLNESNLADLENIKHVVYDYSNVIATQTDALESDEGIQKGKTYVFSIDDSQKNISIIVRFSTSSNNDAQGIVPQIKLISPENEEILIGEKDQKINRESISVDLTWAFYYNYVQLNISKAKEGKWIINTDTDCAFEPTDYSGETLDINEIPSVNESHSLSDADDKNADLEEEDDESAVGAIIMIILSIGAFVGLMVAMKKMPAGSGKEKSVSKKSSEPVKIMTKEEELELLKKELGDMSDEYSDEGYEDDIYSDDVPAKEEASKMEFTEDEINESLEDYSAGIHDMSSEDATTVLSTPEDPWSEIEPSNHFDGTQNNIQNNMDLYEDEE